MSKFRFYLPLCLLLASLSFCLIGCGGGGGGGSTIQPFDAVAYQQMTAASAQAASMYASLVNQANGTAAQQTVDWAKTQPDIVYAEASSDGNALWLEFDTGVVQVITQLPKITPESGSQQPLTYRQTRDVASISGNAKALDLNAAWADWPEGDNQDFMAMMSSRGYDVDGLNGEQVNVQAFSNLNEYSVVYIDTHGPPLEDVPHIGPVFVTREEVTADRDNAQYANDLRNKDLIQAVVLKPQPDGTVIPYHGYYAITANFIANHTRGNFPQNSFVFAKCCSSMASLLMAQAFKSHGLGAYAGWDRPVQIPGSPNTASRLFDLVTAASHYTLSGLYPTVDGKRLPMNLGNAVAAVKAEGFGTLETVGANLLLAYGDSIELQFAPMPHLDSYTIDGDTVTLKGSFGSTSGEVRIEDNGHTALATLQVDSWNTSQIACQAPAENVSGNLVVYVRGLRSNPLPYTQEQWYECFDKSPVGIVASIVGPTTYPSFTGGFDGDECHWIVSGGAPDLVGLYPVYVDAGVEVTAGKSLRLWSNTSGMAVNAFPGWLTVNSQAIPLIPGLRFHCIVSALAGSPTIEFGAFRSLSPSLTSTVTLDHGSGTYDIDLWQLFSTELGSEPQGFDLSVFQMHLWTTGEVTIDDLWIGTNPP